MIRAFGVDHGEFSKGLNPIKGLKALKASRGAEDFARGHRQQMYAHGQSSNANKLTPHTFFSTKGKYEAGQASGRAQVGRLTDPNRPPRPRF